MNYLVETNPMAERDIHDDTARKICENNGGNLGTERAIAAALRKQAFVNDCVYQGMVKECDDIRAENEKLNRCKNSVVEAAVMFPNVGEYIAQLEAERDALKAQLAELRSRK